jgi:predicted ABC-type exoprotein transport system permease subunit
MSIHSCYFISGYSIRCQDLLHTNSSLRKKVSLFICSWSSLLLQTTPKNTFFAIVIIVVVVVVVAIQSNIAVHPHPDKSVTLRLLSSVQEQSYHSICSSSSLLLQTTPKNTFFAIIVVVVVAVAVVSNTEENSKAHK